MKKYSKLIIDNWRSVVVGAALVIFMSFILTIRLGTLNKGASGPEVDYLNSLHSGKNLLSNPMFLIHKLPSYLLFKLHVHRIAIYRLVSAFFASLTVLSGFIILKKAYSTRVAVLGAVLLLTSAWALHMGRSATPEASFFLILPLLLLASCLHACARHFRSLLILAFIIVVSFYTPGFWWLVAAAIIWEHRSILKALKAVPWWFSAVDVLIIILGLSPLLWAGLHHPSVLVAASGLPRHLPNLNELGDNAISIPKNLLVYGPSDPARWLGRLPILDIFSSVMLVLGIYSLRYHFRQHTITVFLAGSSLILMLLITLGGQTTITALIPVLYIFIGAGIAFMLQQWMTVFPHNPVARSMATTLMSIAVLLVSYFHINHYFIAWPQTPATKHAFGNSLLK